MCSPILGYCGADIKAVCAEAALCALRRRYPQIYASSQKLQLDVSSISVGARDFVSAMRKMVPASQRAVVSPAKALAHIVQPLLSASLANILDVVQRVFPHAEQGLRRNQGRGGELCCAVLRYANFFLLSSLTSLPNEVFIQCFARIQRSFSHKMGGKPTKSCLADE